MAIELRPRYPAHPHALQDLAKRLEAATGEDVEFVEVRGNLLIAVIDMIIDAGVDAVVVALAFSEWRRGTPKKEARQIKGVIWGPNNELLREVPEEDG